MSGNAIIGTGILLKLGDGAEPEVFTSVAELISVKPPALSRNEIDTSTHNEGIEAKILGMLRQGQVTGMVNLLPTDATHVSIEDDLNNNTLRNWQIVFPPDGLPVYDFPARVQLWEIQEVGVDAALQAAFALTLAGAMTKTTE